MKIIFTKNQAVSALNCISQKVDIDLFSTFDPKDKQLKLSCEELEDRLRQHISADQIAGVVENEISLNKNA